MRITLNKIDFEIESVTMAERRAILSDPMLAPAVWREVWRWDHEARTGTYQTKGVTSKGQIILPNGVLFFVPKRDGTRSDGPSLAMSKRVLDTLGAKSAVDIMRALATIVQIPQIKLPREPFAQIEKAASFSLRMYTEFSVLRLRNAGRNLSFVIALPGQCLFRHEVTAKDDTAYDALIAEKPDLERIQPRFILAPNSEANRNMRLMALTAWVREMQGIIKAKTAGSGKIDDPVLESAFGRAVSEHQVLSKAAKPAAAPSPLHS